MATHVTHMQDTAIPGFSTRDIDNIIESVDSRTGDGPDTTIYAIH